MTPPPVRAETPATRGRGQHPPSLEKRLLAWLCGAIVLVWGAFLAAGYLAGLHESDELTDGELASAAALVLSLREPRFEGTRAGVPVATTGGRQNMRAHDYQQSLSVFVWDRHGTLLTRHGDAPEPPFNPAVGFADLSLGAPPQAWRAYAQWDTDQARQVMVLLSQSERRELAHDIAGQVADPALWLLPVVLVVLAIAIRRGLASLIALSQRVADLDVTHGEKLGPHHELAELKPIEQAIDALVDAQTARLAREKRLADELAHELRSPLAAIALQAQALQGPLPEADRQHLLQQLAVDARRAGQILTQVLELARAHRAALSEAAQAFDLVALVQTTAADYRRHDPGAGPRLHAAMAHAPVHITGHPLWVEQALFNLIENGFTHGPPGAVVELQIDQAPEGAALVRVLTRAPAMTETPGPAVDAQPLRPVAGLGLGLQIAARVAELHGGRLERRKEAAHAGDAAAQIWELVLAAPMAPNPGAAEAGR